MALRCIRVPFFCFITLAALTIVDIDFGTFLLGQMTNADKSTLNIRKFLNESIQTRIILFVPDSTTSRYNYNG